ncbi:MAG: NADP-dependent oxidoreductase [Rhodospirillaceae bacterium]|nr:NADP-dependent oxidoreductase [Rhodospirillaceae bacterium]
MTQTVHQKVVLAAHPDGLPKPSDFRMEEGPIPEPGENEMLIRTLYIGLEPRIRLMLNPTNDENKAMRPHGAMTDIGKVIPGTVLGVVVKSNNSKYKTGDIVEGFLGWQNYVVTDGEPHPTNNPEGVAICDTDLADPIEFIGPLGAPGLTAILALKHEGKLQQEEAVVITSAAGMVGSLTGQLALLLDAWVVGVTSTDKKCAYLMDELGFDAAINYNSTKDLGTAIKGACPDGVDYFFDNTGGEMADTIKKHMSKSGRITRCGIIANYNKTGWNQSEQFAGQFSVHNHVSEYAEARGTMSDLLKDEGIQYERKVFEGLDLAPSAFIGLLSGRNIGKWIVQVS